MSQARTRCPPRRPAVPAVPSTPHGWGRSSPNPSAFLLTPIAQAARVVTVTNLLQRWIVPPSLVDEDVVLQVRVATVREWAALSDVKILLSPALVAQSSLEADVFAQPNRSVSRMERLVVQVTVTAGAHEGVHVFPRSALKDMLIIHRTNGDFRCGLESKQWIRSLLEPGVLAPSQDPFLVPQVTDVKSMVDAVRHAVGSSKLGDAVWEREVSEVIVSSRGTASTRSVNHRVDVRDLLQVTRPVWMRCSFVDAVLVELSEYAATVGNTTTHVMLCDKFTALTRNGKGKSVQIGVARATANRWAVAVGSSRSVVTLVNHDNSHWCAARIDLDQTEVEFHDPLPTGKKSDRATQFSFSRLKLLGNAILAKQGGAAEADYTREWDEKYVQTPTQSDVVSCGAFSLQYVICAVMGTTPEMAADHCDVLRLTLVHKIVQAGKSLKQAAARVQVGE